MKNVPKALRDYIAGSDTASSGWSIDTSDMSAPFMPFFLIIGGIGVVLLIGGLALAFYLKPHFPAH